MKHSEIHSSGKDLLGESKAHYLAELEDIQPSDKEKLKAYRKDLQTYFINGEKTGECLTEEVYPIRFASFLRGDHAAYDYPVLYDSENDGFTQKTAFQILKLQKKRRSDLNSEFLKKIGKTITGLNELLRLHSGESNLSTAQLDFAEELISFDKIRDIELDAVSSHLPESSLERLRAALQTLLKAQESYSQKSMTIIASDEVIRSFDLKRIFADVNIQPASDNSCYQARLQSKNEIKEFVKTIAALRMGKLLMEQKYEEQLHDAYFDQFDLFYLTKDDLKYLPATIVIEYSRQLMDRSNDFLALHTNDSFVKVLGVNHLDDLLKVNKQDEPDYLELASLAIFRRNSYVFQGGIDRPSKLNEAFKKGLEFPGPVFWNILFPARETEMKNTEYLAQIAAVESRYFPRIEYEADEHTFAGHQIKLHNNPAPDAAFTTYEHDIKSGSGVASTLFHFSIPEFLAMDPRLKATLEIIPPKYQNPKLIPLKEYLSLPPDSLQGKIPFIWMVNQQNKLRQAAVPFNWIQKCRDRLEYWAFLQSIAGVNKVQLHATIEELKSEWEEAKNIEMEKLQSALQEQFDIERSGILEEGISKMLYGLLEEDNLEDVLTQISKKESPPKPEARQDPETPADQSVGEDQEHSEGEGSKAMIDKAWVESEDCTSCKDCIALLPSVFKYNENKQAYVHNPKGGTFAQIVAAAEKCPARCIHPGVPQNKNEPSLEKWMKRAEKFN